MGQRVPSPGEGVRELIRVLVEDTWLADKRYTGDRNLENPLAAVQGFHAVLDDAGGCAEAT
jgi:hypothetical protein